MDHPTEQGQWRTPAGVPCSFFYRTDTSDWNTIAAVLTGDEYGLPTGWPGVFLDVGAHIGAWAIGAALDNPAASVIAIEPLPENVALIRRNIEANDLGERVDVIEAAADSGSQPVTIAYGSLESEFARGHQFIGGGIWSNDARDRRVLSRAPLSLSTLDTDVTMLKIDCEGCEWSFLDDPAIARVEHLVGEYHPRHGLGPARLRELLEATHDVRLDDALPFGPFWADRR